jgi:hypothetical protein
MHGGERYDAAHDGGEGYDDDTRDGGVYYGDMAALPPGK